MVQNLLIRILIRYDSFMNVNSHLSRRQGFTLVEIMIVVAIIALLAAIAVPNFLRARKRSEASKILEDLRQLDNATDEYAMENNKIGGMNPAFADLKAYLKANTVLYNTGADLFGDTYGPFTVDSIIGVPSGAYTALSDVAPVSFWSPYFWGPGS
jgi:prepilin-type N-terminal cleavage/methylation domain-containing protein